MSGVRLERFQKCLTHGVSFFMDDKENIVALHLENTVLQQVILLDAVALKAVHLRLTAGPTCGGWR